MANQDCIHHKNSRALWPLRCHSLRIIPNLEVDVLNIQLTKLMFDMFNLGFASCSSMPKAKFVKTWISLLP